MQEAINHGAPAQNRKPGKCLGGAFLSKGLSTPQSTSLQYKYMPDDHP